MGIRGLALLMLVVVLAMACDERRASTGAALGNRHASPGARQQALPLPTGREAVGQPPTAARGWLVIHGTGDVNLDPDYIPALREQGYAHAWTGCPGCSSATTSPS